MRLVFAPGVAVGAPEHVGSWVPPRVAQQLPCDNQWSACPSKRAHRFGRHVRNHDHPSTSRKIYAAKNSCCFWPSPRSAARPHPNKPSCRGPRQSGPADLNRRVERTVRSEFKIPAYVQISISSPKASEFANYDNITITFATGG